MVKARMFIDCICGNLIKKVMKKVFLLLLLGVILSCSTSKDSVECDKNREILKELFLYKCISPGYPEIEFSKLDGSSSVYFEIGHYAPEAYLKVDSLAKDFVSKIEYENTYYEETKTKGLFIQSFEYLKEAKFNDFIKDLNKYMYK